MPVSVICSACKAKLKAPDTLVGKKLKCPKCSGIVTVAAPMPLRDQDQKLPAETSLPAHDDSPQQPRTSVLAGAMQISITCPTCGQRLKAPEKLAGRLLPCPKCKASIAVPAPNDNRVSTEKPAGASSRAKSDRGIVPSAKPRPPSKVIPTDDVEVVEDIAPVYPVPAKVPIQHGAVSRRRRPIVEEEDDPEPPITRHRRPIVEEEDDLEPPITRRSRQSTGRGFQCPFCGSRQPPRVRKKISAGGWILFCLLLLFLCWPLCWLGLLMKDTYHVCKECGMRLGG